MAHSDSDSGPFEEQDVSDDKVFAKVFHAIDEIGEQTWDACAQAGLSTLGAKAGNPFTRYAFLDALEKSGSVSPEQGWAPYHVGIFDDQDICMGVCPMYLKSHSQGEYVFDHSWADAFYRAGKDYYPKLQVSVPFTPATGARLLVHPDHDQQIAEAQLLAGAVEIASQLDVSSLHFTFLPKAQWQRLGDFGLLQRTDQQFHWLNHDYKSFEDFLSDLASRKRKNLRKERQQALENNITIEWVTGSDLKEHHWDAFYKFYMDTSSRKWGRPYLTRTFFSLIGETMAHQTLLIMCKHNDRYIAGALNFMGDNCLFGRNWGCIEDHRFLHFEACYYQAIDFAITHNIGRVEAGAQGAHKLARGYIPCHTYSAHYIPDPRFREAVAHYLDSERQHVDEHIEILAQHAPFRKSDE